MRQLARKRKAKNVMANFCLTLYGQCTLGIDRSEFVADFAQIRTLITGFRTDERQTRFVPFVRHLVVLAWLQLFAVLEPVNDEYHS